jgi:hypothetical protein
MLNQEDMTMLLLILVMALTDAQQAQHDRDEWKIAHRIQAEHDALSNIWRPDVRLVSDFRKAQSCYKRFHLYKVTTCDAPLAQVETDLGDLEIARAKAH